MTAREALALLESISETRLTTLQTLIFEKAWEGLTYPEMAAELGYDWQYVKYVGSQLWRSLSSVLNQKVSKANIRAVLRRQARYRQQEAPPPSPACDWGEAIDVSHFYGREAQRATLRRWLLRDRCCLVTILGMGGIGKTALAVKLAQELARGEGWREDSTVVGFDRIVWRSLRNAPLPEDLFADLILTLSDRQAANIPSHPGAQISHLLDFLSRVRCLLVLDNCEFILEKGMLAGTYRAGFEDYGELFQRVGEVPHQSCLVLTSREKPREIAALEGERLPVRCLHLAGLGDVESEKILAAKGIAASKDECRQLAERYSGNPLALKIVATSVRDLFGTCLSEFLARDITVFQGIRSLLDRQFERLTPLEQQLMYGLAVNREPVTVDELGDDLKPSPPLLELLDAMESLLRRSLVEVAAGKRRFTQQPVVMEYVTHRLLEGVCSEIVTPGAGSSPRLIESHALLKTNSAEYVRTAQRHLLLQSAIAQLLYQLGTQSQVEHQLQSLLDSLRTARSSIPGGGYAGGNVLNLLRELGTDLQGWDFSGLSLWHADLQGQTLHRVNFSGADLSRCTFTQTLAAVQAVAFSPDGSYLATGDSNCEIRLWQVETGQAYLRLQGHRGWVETLDFHPTESIVASGSNDWTIALWDLELGVRLATLRGHTAWVTGVAFSPDGRTLASSSADGTIRLWQVESRQCDRVLSGHASDVRAVAFSPCGRLLASGSVDHTIKLWEIETGNCLNTLTGHASAVFTLAFSPDGQWLASGSIDKTVRLWEVGSGRCLHQLQGHRDRVDALCFRRAMNSEPEMLGGDSLLASGSLDHTVRLWDAVTGQCLHVLRGHANGVMAVAASPTGQYLASGSDDQTVCLWDWETGRCARRLQGYANSVIAVACHPHGTLLASGGHDGIVRLWDVPGGRCLAALPGHSKQVWRLAFSPDGSLLASGSVDATIRLWEVSTGRCLRCLRHSTPWIFGVAFTPDGRQLVTTGRTPSAPAIQLWDIQTGEMLQSLEDDSVWMRALAIHPDGQIVASGGSDRTVKLWDLRTGECWKQLTGHTGHVEVVAFSPDGTWLASGGSDRTVKLWKTQTGACWQTLEGHANQIRGLSVSPDGQLLASAGNDQTVRIWHPISGQCLRTLQGHTNGIYSVTFAPASPAIDAPPMVVSGSLDETLRLWNAATGECVKVLPMPRPYQGTNITGATGLTPAQKVALQALGAIALWVVSDKS